MRSNVIDQKAINTQLQTVIHFTLVHISRLSLTSSYKRDKHMDTNGKIFFSNTCFGKLITNRQNCNHLRET